MATKSTKKRGRKPGPKLQQLGVRVDADVVKALDGMASDLGLSRAQLVNRLLRDVVRMQAATEQTGLFDEWADHLGDMIEKAMSQAMREGGIDAVLHRAAEAKKAAKKNKRGKA